MENSEFVVTPVLVVVFKAVFVARAVMFSPGVGSVACVISAVDVTAVVVRSTLVVESPAVAETVVATT